MTTPNPYFDESRPYHLRAFELGYDLDGGGYTVDEVQDFGGENAIGNVAVWERPDCDYFPFMECSHNDVDMLVFDMNGWPEWPQRVTIGDSHYALIEDGSVGESDHECNCHGMFSGVDGPSDMKRRIAKAVIAAIPNNTDDFTRLEECLGEWECSGDSGDPPYPFCQRCDGDGYVLSPAGSWAAYRSTDVPTSVNLQAVIDTATGILYDTLNDIDALDLDEEDTALFKEKLTSYHQKVSSVIANLEGATEEDDKLKAVEKLLNGVYLFRYSGDHINGRDCYITYDPAYNSGDGVTRAVVYLSAGPYTELAVREVPSEQA